ncbi:SPOSA6832_03516 [Sporobolomyces salmonicolor]|uniref:Protein disulfide-isomerase n=1 Tax=Sporidiobolus salmonicolor TaxID=5005 RepID=A0A0D6EPH9_SPOSA|nr:SPOSA6832_03516 [Sporobolomyces salmonicolor]
MRFSTLSAISLGAALAAASDVVDLTGSSFQEFTQQNPLTLVEFFAPWCGHCKALAPHYEEAATILKKDNVPIAKVDCTVETELCSSMGVNGYPCAPPFPAVSDLEGVPTRRGGRIRQALPAVSEVTTANHNEFKSADKVVIIAYVDESDEATKTTFNNFADLYRDDYLFGLSTEPAVAAVANVKAPAVVLYKTFDEGRNELDGKITDDSLFLFAKEHSVPLLDEISPDNFAMYAEAGIPLAYIFVESSNPKREQIVKAIEPIAREHKGKINFVWIDANKFADHAKSLNLVEPTWPAFAIQNIQQMTKFPLSQSKSVDHDTVSAFVADFVAGKISPSIKSQKVPAVQDEPVFVLVADEFDKVVAEDKDLLVEFYAPWCGHCKKLKPIYDTLGERFSNVKSKVTIAKFDATENDVPASAGFKVQGFPTIKFKAAGSSEWISYEGDRSLDSFVEFLEANATHDLATPDDLEAELEGESKVKSERHDELRTRAI